MTSCAVTYCTNIHPGESWPEVRDVLCRELPRLRRRLGRRVPAGPFPVGLRLSATAAEALSEPAALDELKRLLAGEGLWVPGINGFPYGGFHGGPVKTAVYAPDWRHPARLDYADRLADILAALLPEGAAGSVTTVPVGLAGDFADPAEQAHAAGMLLRHVAHLDALRRRSGRSVAVALEPEPGCLLETAADAAAFIAAHLRGPAAAARLAALAGLTEEEARQALVRHVALCLDACHEAVMGQDAGTALARLRAEDIAVARLQASAALSLPRVTPGAIAVLAPFARSIYLHQVVESGPWGRRFFLDLPQALADLAEQGGERGWRIHLHVPVHLAALTAPGGITLATTQPLLADLLARQRAAPFTPLIEVETYSWSLLPEGTRGGDVTEDVARELLWVAERLEGMPS